LAHARYLDVDNEREHKSYINTYQFNAQLIIYTLGRVVRR
jgi:hypothetical protein